MRFGSDIATPSNAKEIPTGKIRGYILRFHCWELGLLVAGTVCHWKTICPQVRLDKGLAGVAGPDSSFASNRADVASAIARSSAAGTPLETSNFAEMGWPALFTTSPITVFVKTLVLDHDGTTT